jgi:hypothetical protein
MVRTLRALVIAVVVAVSLLGSASVASADPGPATARAPIEAPLPITVLFDISWE